MMRSPSGGRQPQKRPVEQRTARVSPEPARPQQVAPTVASSQVSSPKKPKSKRKLLWAGLSLAIAAGLIVAAIFLASRFGSMAAIDSSRYQAVFFTNGQVYFGKLEDLNSDYMRLTDVFYLQSQQSGSQAGDSENPQESSTDQSDVQLIKLGDEIHGPEDEMIISKQQLLFFENLKDDGQVSKSISTYRSSN